MLRLLRAVLDQEHEPIVRGCKTEGSHGIIERDERCDVTVRTSPSARRHMLPQGSTRREPRSLSTSQRKHKPLHHARLASSPPRGPLHTVEETLEEESAESARRVLADAFDLSA